ncbi:MAG TPA: hypothetical protein VFH39_04415, partial [Candidatus Saccharimonadales bacterium]|nr:hypothetical protein [Candidatus Saccharimonadales bacterium]
SEKDFPKHSVPLEIVKDYARLNDYYIEEIPDPVAALGALQQRSEPVLIVCGSFYLMNHIRPLLLEKAV